CMIVLATDAPLSSRNLERLARRATLALGRTGSYVSDGSGDFAIAFSTAERVLEATAAEVRTVERLGNDAMSPLFLAAVEAVEEAIYNSLLKATTVRGHRGTIEALPLEPLRDLLERSRFPVEPELFLDVFQAAEGITFNGEGQLFVGADRAVWTVAPDGATTRLTDVHTHLGQAGIGARDVLAADFGPTNVFRDKGGQVATDGIVWRVTPEGDRTMVATGIADPNFVLVLGDGSFLVSDDGTHHIYRVTADGAVSLWSDAVPFPNGMALSLDGSTLYVAQIFSALDPVVYEDRLWALPLADGEPTGEPELVFEGRGGGAFDGLAMDAVGRVYVADNAHGEIWRYDPATEIRRGARRRCRPATSCRSSSAARSPPRRASRGSSRSPPPAGPRRRCRRSAGGRRRRRRAGCRRSDRGRRRCARRRRRRWCPRPRPTGGGRPPARRRCRRAAPAGRGGAPPAAPRTAPPRRRPAARRAAAVRGRPPASASDAARRRARSRRRRHRAAGPAARRVRSRVGRRRPLSEWAAGPFSKAELGLATREAAALGVSTPWRAARGGRWARR
ncbi:MAG TPA: P1 family peptidase, partial [Thermoanaerobaculia bacterium]|nr:P1 family peptidase [Thermoanaerobaculia bacterium]